LPRDLGDVLDYLLPRAVNAAPATDPSLEAARETPVDTLARSPRPPALPILALPIGDHDVVRAAFAWNLTVEIARLGASATLLAPAESNSAPLWPPPGRGPIGAELALVQTANLQQLNRAALDIAVSRAADATDGGVVLVRVPLDWMRGASNSRALLRWVLLFASPESTDLREAYGLTKSVLGSGATSRVGITIHGARGIAEAERAFGRLAGASAPRGRELWSARGRSSRLSRHRRATPHRPGASPIARSTRAAGRRPAGAGRFSEASR